MKIFLKNCDDLLISSLEALEQLIPPGWNGRAINYGQGEGQIEIENTTWGLYYHSQPNSYLLQFEQGHIEFLTLHRLSTAIIANISKKLGHEISAFVEGNIS